MEKVVNHGRNRIAVGSAFFIHGLCFSSWGSQIPNIQQNLSLSEASLGTLLFAIPIGSILSMPFASWMVEKFGSHKILSPAISLYGLMLISLSLATTATQLAGFLVIFGITSNLVNVSVNTQAVAIETLLKRSVMSSLHGFWSLAGFVGAGIGAIMIGTQTSPLHHFIFIFVLALVILILNRRAFIQEAPVPRIKKASSLPDKNLLILGLIAFCSMISEGAMFDWSGVYFKKVINTRPEFVGLGYAAFMSTMAGTRFVADRLTVQFGNQNVLKGSGILIFTGLLISVLFPHLLMGILGFLIVGAGTSAVVPLVLGQAGKVTDRSPSNSIATVSTIGFLGFLFGPPMIGWIAGQTSLRISFSIIAIMGLSIFFLARKRQDL